MISTDYKLLITSLWTKNSNSKLMKRQECMNESVNYAWCSPRSNSRMNPYSKLLVANLLLVQKICWTQHKRLVHTISNPPTKTMAEAICWTLRWTWISRQSNQRITMTEWNIAKRRQVDQRPEIRKYQVIRTLLSLNNQSGLQVAKLAMRYCQTYVTRSNPLVASWMDMWGGSSHCKTLSFLSISKNLNVLKTVKKFRFNSCLKISWWKS